MWHKDHLKKTEYVTWQEIKHLIGYKLWVYKIKYGICSVWKKPSHWLSFVNGAQSIPTWYAGARQNRIIRLFQRERFLSVLVIENQQDFIIVHIERIDKAVNAPLPVFLLGGVQFPEAANPIADLFLCHGLAICSCRMRTVKSSFAASSSFSLCLVEAVKMLCWMAFSRFSITTLSAPADSARRASQCSPCLVPSPPTPPHRPPQCC